MTPDRWRLVEKLVGDALELHGEKRAAYLDAACGEDSWLRTEAERILAGYDDNFLEDPPGLLGELINESNAARVFDPGEQVADRFRIVKWLARGGMGEVYEAEDSELPGVRIALKTVRGQIAWSDALRQQFRREVELARKVTHPNVCRIYDLNRHRQKFENGDEEDSLVLSMELLEGETLSESLRRDGAMAPEIVRPIALAILNALGAAHAAGVMHGDLKPNNVMLVADGGTRRAVVMDFGLAHPAQENGFPGGAPAYMAPEQFLGNATTPATDIYGFGVLLYEMSTGRHPFPRVDTFEEAMRTERPRPENPRAFAPHLDQRWAAAILRCLEPEPSKRFQSVQQLRDAVEADNHVTRRHIVIAAALLLSGAGSLVYRQFEDSKMGTVVAVLPFENAGGDPRNRYFVEGLSDELRDCLARVPGLRVIARTSSSEVSLALVSFVATGQRLSATHIVSGTGRRDGGNVRVTVRLINARNGLELWRREYVKTESDALATRIEIAAAIAPALGFQLRKGMSIQFAQGRTTNSAAFDYYLRARTAVNLRGTENLQQGLDLYGEALKLDPEFALAWAGQAEAREMLAGRSGYPLIQWMTEARQDAFRALELCPELPEALVETAMIRQRFDWDWQGAEEYFRKAIALNPNFAEGHRLYAGLLSNLGREQESVREILIARQLDPLSIHVQNLYAAVLYRTRRYSDALDEYQRMVRNNPDFRNAYMFLPEAYGQLGRWDEAIASARQAVERFNGESRFLYTLGFVLAKSGRTDEARQILAVLEARWPTERFTPAYLALIHLALGEPDAMFEWLERCWMERDPNLQTLRIEPWFDPYRKDPRFQDLMRRVRLE